MMPGSEDRKRRRDVLRTSGPDRERRPRGSQRFLPMNAIVDGGWLPALRPTETRVWIVLFRFANPQGEVRISHTTIARLCGIRREHAARATASLERRGVIVVVSRGRTFGSHGQRLANVYRLQHPEAKRAEKDTGKPPAPDRAVPCT